MSFLQFTFKICQKASHFLGSECRQHISVAINYGSPTLQEKLSYFLFPYIKSSSPSSLYLEWPSNLFYVFKYLNIKAREGYYLNSFCFIFEHTSLLRQGKGKHKLRNLLGMEGENFYGWENKKNWYFDRLFSLILFFTPWKKNKRHNDI